MGPMQMEQKYTIKSEKLNICGAFFVSYPNFRFLSETTAEENERLRLVKSGKDTLKVAQKTI